MSQGEPLDGPAVSDGRVIRLHALRHAKVVTSGICYGQTEVAVELSPDEAARRVIRDFPALASVTRTIWTSPLRRVQELAECLSARFGLSLHVDVRLMELDFGAWEGRSWDEIYRSERANFTAWAEDPFRRAPPSGETARSLLIRVRAWLQTIPDDGVLIVTHAGPIRVLRALCESGQDGSPIRLDFERAVPPLAVEQLKIPRPATGAT